MVDLFSFQFCMAEVFDSICCIFRNLFGAGIVVKNRSGGYVPYSFGEIKV